MFVPFLSSSDDELAGGLGPDDDMGTAVRVLGGAGV